MERPGQRGGGVVCVLVFAGVMAFSSDVLALTSTCSDVHGTCTVMNLPDSVDCDCGDVAIGGTGGDDWDMFDQEELDAVCCQRLLECALAGSTSYVPDTCGSEDSTTSGDMTTGTSTGPNTTTTGDPDTTTTTTGGPEDTTTTGDSFGLTTGDASGTTAAGPDLTGGATLSGSTTLSGPPPDPTTPDPTASEGESTGDTHSEAVADDTGCGCRSPAHSPAFAAFAVLGLLALGRPRRRTIVTHPTPT